MALIPGFNTLYSYSTFPKSRLVEPFSWTSMSFYFTASYLYIKLLHHFVIHCRKLRITALTYNSISYVQVIVFMKFPCNFSYKSAKLTFTDKQMNKTIPHLHFFNIRHHSINKKLNNLKIDVLSTIFETFALRYNRALFHHDVEIVD